MCPQIRRKPLCDPYRARAFQNIEHGRCKTCPEACGAHRIRAASAATLYFTNIFPRFEFNDQQSKRDRAENIREQNNSQVEHNLH